jgi:Ni/Fe-hydrogenase subunit HybB-like protein
LLFLPLQIDVLLLTHDAIPARGNGLAKRINLSSQHLNRLQQFVLTCAMFLAALLAHPIHFSIAMSWCSQNPRGKNSNP